MYPINSKTHIKRQIRLKQKNRIALIIFCGSSVCFTKAAELSKKFCKKFGFLQAFQQAGKCIIYHIVKLCNYYTQGYSFKSEAEDISNDSKPKNSPVGGNARRNHDGKKAGAEKSDIEYRGENGGEDIVCGEKTFQTVF